jgi:hypothetical protein
MSITVPRPWRKTACLMLLALSPLDAAAQSEAGALVRMLADGKPWALTIVPENRTGRLTLNPDGTGAMEGGPIPMSPTWRATADGLCLKPGMMMPERCVSLKREGAAIVGTKDGAVLIRLQR